MPRYDALSLHDRSLIIAQLAGRSRQWEGSRAGCKIRFVRYSTQNGERIDYAVQLKRTWISDHADTVADAIDACNRLIAGAPIHGTAGNRSYAETIATPDQAPAIPGGLF